MTNNKFIVNNRSNLTNYFVKFKNIFEFFTFIRNLEDPNQHQIVVDERIGICLSCDQTITLFLIETQYALQNY